MAKHYLAFGHERLKMKCSVDFTLTDPTLSCPGSLLKTTPSPPGYPWVSRGRHGTPESRFRGLVLDHQLLKAPQPKIDKKEPNLIKNCSFWVVF